MLNLTSSTVYYSYAEDLKKMKEAESEALEK